MIGASYAYWQASVISLDEDDLARDVGHVEPWPVPMAELILDISREIIHDAAEVALLRDLYCASNNGRALLSPLR